MQYELLSSGSFMMLKVKLENGESIKAEAGAMVAVSPTIEVSGRLEGGIIRGLARTLAGEKFFFQQLTASRGPGEALLAPALPGEIFAIPLDGRTDYLVQKDGFLAATAEIEVSTKIQNLLKGLFSGEGFFVLKASGLGTLFVNSFGAILPLDIPSGQELVIDNGHLVAWPASADYSIEKAARGWISSITSGEFLVLRFRGPARVLIQSRNPHAFAAWIADMLPRSRS
ncbi:MAG: TIGR00266 family protein [Thermoguttaceae bacterium]|nr:TIGR00266 family protein [Thermoguttaceae bacterium]MDW8078201.1 TIGR00266 family protein [Thermoguttaceae bacterium]